METKYQNGEKKRMRRFIPLLLTPLCCLSLSGCLGGTRTVYVKDGNPVRIRKTIPQTEVWVQDGTGVWIEGKCDLPEGWYALPDPGKKP